MIFHYCDSTAFINIIKSKVLWASDLTKMNDPDEIMRGTQIINRLYKSIFPESDISIDRMSSPTEREDLIVACSMSKNGDVLSQWRAYANDGTGFSVGVDTKKLRISNLGPGSGTSIPGYEFHGVPHYQIEDVLYDEGTYENKWKRDMMDFQKKYGYPFKKIGNDIRIGDDFAVTKWLEATCLLKSDFYFEEQEVRIFKSIPIRRVGDKLHNTGIDFRATSNGVKAFSCIKLNGHSQNCIKEVIIGPKNQSTKDDINMLLKLNGIEDVVVKHSDGNYR